jgi:hypothetical protein
MGAPFTVVNPATDQVVYNADAAGNTQQNGYATMGRGVVLGANGAPATPAPGSVLLYSPDGQVLQYVNAAGVAQTVTAGGIPLSTVTAKGDLIVGTGNAAVARLAVGADGTVLTAASGQADGMQWSVPSGGTTTWTSYSPSLNNVTQGNGTLAGSYFQQGKLCIVTATFVMGSTSSISGTIGITLPFTAATVGSGATWMGPAWGNPAGAVRLGSVVVGSGGVAMTVNSDNTANWNATVPGTWATGNTMTFTLTYQTV